MPFQVSDRALRLLTVLIAEKVLTKVRLSKVAEERGEFPRAVGFIDCSDCDQRQRWRDYFQLHMRELNPLSVMHTFTLHGGAILIPDHSLANKNGENGRVMIENIKEAPQIKDELGLICVTSHAPCGKAKASGITLPEVIQLTLSAEGRVANALGNSKIITLPCIHINYGPWQKGRLIWGMKSYELARPMWTDWFENSGNLSRLLEYYDEGTVARCLENQKLIV